MRRAVRMFPPSPAVDPVYRLASLRSTVLMGDCHPPVAGNLCCRRARGQPSHGTAPADMPVRRAPHDRSQTGAVNSGNQGTDLQAPFPNPLPSQRVLQAPRALSKRALATPQSTHDDPPPLHPATRRGHGCGPSSLPPRAGLEGRSSRAARSAPAPGSLGKEEARGGGGG